jgi:GT2 family glycosyltransferase
MDDAASPLISIVMPVYNASGYVKETMVSIFDQSFQDFEIIAVDDGSTDDSVRILESFTADSRLRIIRQANTGIVGALNAGLEAARGEYIARMDADDRMLPQRLQRQWQYLQSHRECVALGTAYVYIDHSGRPLKHVRRFEQHEEIERQLLTGDGGSIIHPTLMARKSALAAVGGYRKEAEWIEDLDLYLRLGRVGRLANLSEALLEYRFHRKSVNFTRHAIQQERRGAVLAQAYAARGLSLPLRPAPEAASSEVGSDAYAEQARDFAITSLRFPSRRVPWEFAWEAIRRQPSNPQSWRVFTYLLKVFLGLIPRPKPDETPALAFPAPSEKAECCR